MKLTLKKKKKKGKKVFHGKIWTVKADKEKIFFYVSEPKTV